MLWFRRISARRVIARLLLGVLFASALTFLASAPASATHFRFRDLTWRFDHASETGNVVELTMRIADRRSYYGSSLQVGSSFSTSVETGDGSWVTLQGQVVAVNPVDDWFIAEVRGMHTYPTAGPYTVSWESCCTLSTLRNSPDSSLRTTTVVNMDDGNTTSPVSLVSPIVHLPAKSEVQSFRIPATDFDGDNVEFRLATQAESLVTQPPGLTIDSRTGVVSWDTTGRPNGLWMVTAVLSDPSGASTMNSFLVNLGGTASPPPVWTDPTPDDRSNLSAPVDGVVQFTLAAEDPDGQAVTITPLNDPEGLTCVDSKMGNRTEMYCGWRPTQAGTHLVAFDAQDSTGASAGLRVYRLTTPRYVAFGDSYSSGEGALDEDNYEENTNGDTGGNGCRRASTAYPALLAGDAGVPADFDFVACSGARTWHFEEAQHPNGPGKVQEAQFERAALGQDVELVTLSIGGNDAMFADILKECIIGGFFEDGDCVANPDKAEHVVQDAFARLRGEPTKYGKGEEKTLPLARVYSRILREAPRARVIVMGYPQFFRTGGTHLFKCSLVTKADQIWVNGKVAEINDLLEQQATSLGLEFIDPSDAFEGHRLCEIGGGEDREWFRDIVLEWDSQVKDDAAFHPDDDGHFAEYQLLLQKLADPPEQFTMTTGEIRDFYIDINDALQSWLDLFTRWPGSDVEMTVTSPSGVVYTRDDVLDAQHLLGPTFESFRIPTPEQGRWHVRLYGADLGADGEPVSFSSQVRSPWNYPPEAVMSARLDGRTLHLDAAGSADPEGDPLTTYHWIIRDSEGTVVAEPMGRTVQHEFAAAGRYVVTLRVEDTAGKSGFVGAPGAFDVTGFYQVDGPQAPLVGGGEWNVIQAGRTLPVKWRLTGSDGQPISDPASFARIGSRQVGCEDGAQNGEEVAGDTAGTSGLSYHQDGNWQYNLQTAQAWSGTCRLVTVSFDDGSTIEVRLRMR